MVTIEERLAQWQQELLDLTNRNRLLNYRFTPSRPSSLNLITPSASDIFQVLLSGKALAIQGSGIDEPEDEASPRLPDEAVDDQLLVQPESIALESIAITTGTVRSSLSNEKTNRVARRLHVQARSSEQEQGINILFASFGLLKWNDKPGDEKWRYAPLVLLPVRLAESARDDTLRIESTGDDAEFNQTLSERLKRDFGFSLAVEIDEETVLAEVLNEIRTAISKRPGWEVLDQVHIGLFQFHKIRMFRDLAEHASIAASHPIVQALGLEGVGIAPLPDGVPSEEQLDASVSPATSFSFLDADASQLHAIQVAVHGADLIIQGPPGTGKSQTIANIIGEFIAAGKTVLFVSEKAAAIEVVHSRLSDRGLGDFCLMLHSHKATKREVVTSLGDRLENKAGLSSSSENEWRLRELGDIRSQLNAYPDALHRKQGSLQESAFWAHSQLAALQSVPFLSVVPPPIDDLTHERLFALGEIVRAAERDEATLREGAAHPWAQVNPRPLSLAEEQTLRQSLLNLQTSLATLAVASKQLAEHLSLRVPTSVEDVRRLVRVAEAIPDDEALRPEWFQVDTIQRMLALSQDAASRAKTIGDQQTRLLADYSDTLLTLPASDAIASYEQGWIGRLFSGTYRSHRNQLRQAAKNGQNRSRDEELATLRAVRDFDSQKTWFREHQSELNTISGASSDANSLPSHDQWATTTKGVETVARMLEAIPDAHPPQAFIDAVSRSGAGLSVAGIRRRLADASSVIDSARSTLEPYFLPHTLTTSVAPWGGVNLSTAREWVDVRLQRFDDRDRWVRAHATVQRLREAQPEPAVRYLTDNNVPVEQWEGAVRKLVLTQWLDHVRGIEPDLQTFRGEDHERAIARFRELDRAAIHGTVRRIKRELAQRQGRFDPRAGGEPEILRREYAKKRRHLPLRRLFERIPNLIPTLKPCLMMSPLSVAQFLSPDRYRFDVVIFDEASQVQPHDAIGAIMRGKQVIVAGDEHQLPPTSFFDRQYDGSESDDDADDLRDMESILKALQVRGMEREQLRWHYRSRHEDLIAFSNYEIYKGNLITFPTAETDHGATRGVHLDYVANGRYETEQDRLLKTPKRVNRIEAKRVAQLVMKHARTRPTESLAVVALNTSQRDVIEEEVKRIRQLDASVDEFFAESKPEHFFVKALEEVQGDERDVMLISIGYGKNAKGELSHNFGPINRDGGYRRLNVLVTRAKHQVIVVSSIRSGDIDLSRTSALGPRLLRTYLDFAERGRIALEAETVGGDGDYDSPFEEEVGEALARAGYTVRRQIGSSRFRIDLGIVDPEQPGRYLVGIECDGATYHSSKTARDRDRLRQDVLEGLGWRIHRIWSTDWMRAPDRELQRAIDRIEEIRREPRETPEPYDADGANLDVFPDEFPPEHSLQTDIEPAPVVALVEAYRVASLDRLASGDILSVGLGVLNRVVMECISTEGPIHEELLARRVTNAWGLQRTGSRIAERIKLSLRDLQHQGRIEKRDSFWFVAGGAEVVLRGSASDGWSRDVKYISDEEIRRAFLLVLEQAFSLSGDELIQQTARLFGYSRTGADITRRFQAVIEESLALGTLVRKDGRVELPKG